MKIRFRRGLVIVCALAATGGVVGTYPAIAAGGHEHGADAPALRLDDGTKWRTDEPLRRGMLKIRAAVEKKLPAVHGGTLSDAQYEALGEVVEGQIAYIVGNCKLEPQADAVLHRVIADLSDGAAVVAGRTAVDSRSKGVMHLVDALDNYGTYFDHPDWKPVTREH